MLSFLATLKIKAYSLDIHTTISTWVEMMGSTSTYTHFIHLRFELSFDNYLFVHYNLKINIFLQIKMKPFIIKISLRMTSFLFNIYLQRIALFLTAVNQSNICQLFFISSGKLISKFHFCIGTEHISHIFTKALAVINIRIFRSCFRFQD